MYADNKLKRLVLLLSCLHFEFRLSAFVWRYTDKGIKIGLSFILRKTCFIVSLSGCLRMITNNSIKLMNKKLYETIIKNEIILISLNS